jgi:hypothetical protein
MIRVNSFHGRQGLHRASVSPVLMKAMRLKRGISNRTRGKIKPTSSLLRVGQTKVGLLATRKAPTQRSRRPAPDAEHEEAGDREPSWLSRPAVSSRLISALVAGSKLRPYGSGRVSTCGLELPAPPSSVKRHRCGRGQGIHLRSRPPPQQGIQLNPSSSNPLLRV